MKNIGKVRVTQVSIRNADGTITINWDTRMNSPVFVVKHIDDKKACKGHGYFENVDGVKKMFVRWDNPYTLYTSIDEQQWINDTLAVMQDHLHGKFPREYFTMGFI